MSALYSGKHIVYGFAEESVFGTPVADAAAFNQMACEPFVINPDVKQRAPNRASGYLHPDIAHVWNDSLGAMPNCSIKFPGVQKNHLAFLLYLVFQNVVEAGTTPFQKTFTFPSVGPDFSANGGEFITLIGKSPVAAASEKVTSMIGRSLSLTLNPTADEGNLAAELALVGKAFSRSATPSGTWTKAANNLFNFHNIALCTLGGSNLILSDMKFNIECAYEPGGSDGAGSFQNLVLTGINVTTEVTGLWDTVTRAALDAFSAGTEIDFILKWGTTGVDGYLSVASKGIVQQGALVEEDSRRVSVTIHGASDKDNTQEISTLELADAIDRAW